MYTLTTFLERPKKMSQINCLNVSTFDQKDFLNRDFFMWD